VDTGNHLVGTLPYMAPEQLEGHAATTASDVYAFGLVMYEMVTGRQPFSGVTPLSAIYKRLQTAPPAPHTLAPDLDDGLEKVILRCLEREPEARYANASDVANVLAEAGHPVIPEWVVRQRVWIGTCLLLLALLLGVLRVFYMRYTTPPVKGENLVVLPFTAVGNRSEDVVYCDGFTVVVTEQLSRIPSLAVAPAFEVHDKQVKTVDDARAELGASRVLQAHWQRLGDEIRVTLPLRLDSSATARWSARAAG
jgi:TolB-like protein